MKIIIRESKIEMLMTDYLNSWVESKNILNYRDFILIQEKAGFDEDDFKRFLSDLFAKSVLDIIPFVTEWFENKFNVKVEYTE